MWPRTVNAARGQCRRRATAVAAVIVSVAVAVPTGAAEPSQDPEKSAAVFERLATVLQHPRCINCHSSTQFPRQGDDQHRHSMNVARGPADHGAAGLHCNTCHQLANQSVSGVPGAEDWHLAPLRMAWEGLSIGELCRAIKDPARGAMVPAQLVDHFNTPFVLWAWAPGRDARGRVRSTPPMTHEEFIAATQEWIATGAACPAP